MPDSRLRLDDLDIFVSAFIAETQILNKAQSCNKPVNFLDLQVNEY